MIRVAELVIYCNIINHLKSFPALIKNPEQYPGFKKIDELIAYGFIFCKPSVSFE